jgi:hypothetical protein
VELSEYSDRELMENAVQTLENIENEANNIALSVADVAKKEWSSPYPWLDALFLNCWRWAVIFLLFEIVKKLR